MDNGSNDAKLFNPQVVADRLKAVRVSVGMSQEEFGKVIGSNRAHIYRCEANTASITAIMLDQIAQQFGVSFDYLFGRTEVMQSVTMEQKKAEAEAFRELFVSKEALRETLARVEKATALLTAINPSQAG